MNALSHGHRNLTRCVTMRLTSDGRVRGFTAQDSRFDSGVSLQDGRVRMSGGAVLGSDSAIRCGDCAVPRDDSAIRWNDSTVPWNDSSAPYDDCAVPYCPDSCHVGGLHGAVLSFHGAVLPYYGAAQSFCGMAQSSHGATAALGWVLCGRSACRSCRTLGSPGVHPMRNDKESFSTKLYAHIHHTYFTDQKPVPCNVECQHLLEQCSDHDSHTYLGCA